MFIFLGRLSLGEFIAIWTSTLILVFFYLLLLYYFIQIEKKLNLLQLKVKRISDLL
jgi:hypothetical protein